ncbi:hypothetical protein [Nocardioides pakistanensis]
MTYTQVADRTTVTSHHQPAPGRGWTFAGIGAGIAGITGIAASMTVDAVYDESLAGQPDAIVARLAELTPNLLVFHVATMVCVVTLLVFAAGLRRRLAAQAPSGSLLPDVAATGLGLTAVAGLLGAGLNTEFIFGVQDGGETGLLPESAVFFNHWVGTIPWLWVGAGVAGVAVAVAALRHSAAPRWIGLVGAVLGGLTLALGISPLQYMAGMTGPLWLLVTALGFAAADRSAR